MSSTLAERWRDAAEDVRARLKGRQDLDRCAELLLDSAGDHLRVKVTLIDGRTATREVASPDSLFVTVNALLSLPPPDTLRAPEGYFVAEHRDAVTRGATVTTHAPQLEVGIGAMARAASSPLYGGIGLTGFAQLNLGRWLVGVSARWDAADALLADAPPSGFNMQTLALGVQVGIRSSLRGLTLDTSLGPQVRIENQEAFGGETAADGIGGGTSDVRLDASLRLATPLSGPTRFFAEGDVDASPARLRKARRLDSGLPTLPAWSAGLGLGVLWSLP